MSSTVSAFEDTHYAAEDATCEEVEENLAQQATFERKWRLMSKVFATMRMSFNIYVSGIDTYGQVR